MSTPSGSTASWTIIPFVDNRALGSSHHTYKITPQRGVYGSMFLDDAVLAAAAPVMLACLKDIQGFLKRSGYDTRLVSEVIAKATGSANA